GQLAGLNCDQTVLNLIGIFEQTTLRRPRGARAIAIVRAAVAWTHEQTRLWEPADGAAEMRAVDCENLKLLAGDTPHPAGGVHGLAVGWHHVGILKCSQPGFTLRKFTDFADRHPGEVGAVAAACDRREQILDDRNCERRSYHCVEENPQT